MPKPCRPSRPFPILDLPSSVNMTSPPPPEQFWFASQSKSTQASARRHVDRRAATGSFMRASDKDKSFLRRAINYSVSHARTLSSGSLNCVRAVSRRAVCTRRASVYDVNLAAPDTLPTRLEPAEPEAVHRQSSRVSRVILQVPRTEPLLPAVLQAADDVALKLALAELAHIVTPGESEGEGGIGRQDGKQEAARPDSQLLPSDLDCTKPSMPRSATLPARISSVITGPVVSCSRRASRPVWAYI